MRLRTLAITICFALLASALVIATGPNKADALSHGITFGAYAQPINGQTNQRAIELLESALGTKLPMVRSYGDWDDPIGQDKPLHRWVRDGGRDLMVSVKPKRDDGSIVTWSEVASARPGSKIYREMQDLAQGILAYNEPVIFGFHHEPEQGANQKYGTSADFRAAFRKVRQVFDSEGVRNAHFAWIMTEWAFEVETINPQDRRRADLWYPGDDVVDMIASDTYNWNNCRGNSTDPWRSFEDNLAPLMRFHAKHPGKKLVLGEFGSDEGAAGRKAEWMRDAQALLKKAPYRDAFAAVLYFHDDGRGEGWPQCDWWLDSSVSSRDAARTWVKDSFYRAELDSPAGQTPPVVTTTTKPTPIVPTTKPATPVAHFCDGKLATVVGTSAPDSLRGTAGDDVIVGLGGNDRIEGLQGNDTICGGPGNDEIFGDGGSDRLFGQAGADFILGGYGPDLLVGGMGPDRLNGQNGNDTVFGSEGNDVLRGGPHQDVLRGGAHADLILGQGGFDNIAGGSGNDRLHGGVGADTIVGGTGLDRCNGDAGRDTVNCEQGL